MGIIHNWNLKIAFALVIFISTVTNESLAQKIEGQVYKREVELEERFIEAKRMILLGEDVEAEKVYLNLFHEGKEKGLAAYELSRLYHTLDSKEDCLKFANTAVLEEPKNEWFLHHLINVATVLQADEDAKLALNKLIKISPDDRPNYKRLVFLHNEARDFDGSLKTLKEAEKKFGSEWWIVKEKHRSYFQKGEDVEALQELEAFIVEHPEHTTALRTATSFAINMKDYEKANSFNNALLLANPKDKYAKQLQKSINKKRKIGNDANNKLADLNLAIQNPDLSLDAKVKKMIPYLLQDEVLSVQEKKDLIPFIDELIETHPNEEKLVALKSDVYSYSGDLMSAVKLYQQVLEKNKAVFTVWSSLMSCLNDLHAYDELGHVAEESIELYPNQSYPYLYTAIVEREKGNVEDAMSLLDEAELIATDGDVILDYINIERGKILKDQGDLNAALSQFRKSYNSEQSDLEIKVSSYLFFIDNNKLMDSDAQAIKTLSKSNPQSALINWAKAKMFISENKIEEAIASFLKADKVGDLSENMHFLLDYETVLKNAGQQELLSEVENRIRKINQFVKSLKV